MVLVGRRDAVYLSHIPMFRAPHDVQLVLAARFPAAAPSLPSTFSDQLYTFVPETLSLDALRLGARKTVHGALYQGNFESGGQKLADGVTLEITRVLYARVLAPDDPPAPEGYVVFGEPGEAFAAHRIISPPGFDQIARVRVAGVEPGALSHGVVVEAGETSADDPAHLASGAVTGTTKDGAGVTITARNIISCLRGPDFTDPCRDARLP
jgi:hypothetical protein